MELMSFILIAQLQLSTPTVPHLTWAKRLVEEISPRNNAYGSTPTVVEWRGINGANASRNRSVCSTFITRLFYQSYGYDRQEMVRWLGTPSPSALQYYNAIETTNRFQPVDTVSKIKPGDLLASKRLFKNSAITGHVMIAASQVKLVKQTTSSSGLPKTLRQYELEVFDSSRSGHGPMDTRHLADGTWGKGGAGKGTILLQTDASGKLRGYRWSNRKESPLRTVELEPLLIGRFSGLPCRLSSCHSNQAQQD